MALLQVEPALFVGLVFVFGLLIGSFLNVCIYRIPRSESIVWPGSRCTACGARGTGCWKEKGKGEMLADIIHYSKFVKVRS